MKTFNTFDELALARVLTGTPVRVLQPALVDGVVEATGEGLSLLSGNVFVPRFDDQEAVTGRKTSLLADQFTGNLATYINRYRKDDTGAWVAGENGRTSNVFYNGQIWWTTAEVDYLPNGYLITSWSIPTDNADRLEVTTSLGTIISFSRYLGLSTPSTDEVTPVSQGRQVADGVTSVFSAPNPEATADANLIVSVDGFLQAPTISFTSSPGQITFTEVPPLGSMIDITYYHPVSIDIPPNIDLSNNPVTSTGSSIPRTLQDRFSNEIYVKDFGVTEDGVTDDSDAWDAVIAEYKLRPRTIRIGGWSRLTRPLVYQTQGWSIGLDIEGTGYESSGFLGDFNGDTLISIDGSSLEAFRFQEFGGFRRLGIRMQSGAVIKRAVTLVGWSRATWEQVLIGEKGIRSFTENGILIPLRVDIDANPDAYASVSWTMRKCIIDSCGADGLLGLNNQGYAGWVLDTCAFERNGGNGCVVHAGAWKFYGGSQSYNEGYGLVYQGESGVTLTNILVQGLELDGNTTGGVLVERVNGGLFYNLRIISRFLNGGETSLNHIVMTNSFTAQSLQFHNTYHRIESSMTSNVTLMEGGTGSSNVQGNEFKGYQILDAGAGGYTLATAGLIQGRWKNLLRNRNGANASTPNNSFTFSGGTNQTISAGIDVVLFDTDVRNTGWTDYDQATGVLTVPYDGFYHFDVFATANTPQAGARVRLFIYKNNVIERQYYWDWDSTSTPVRETLSISDLLELAEGDLVDIRMDCTGTDIPLFDLGRLIIKAL